MTCPQWRDTIQPSVLKVEDDFSTRLWTIRQHRSIGGLFLYIGRSPAGSCLLDVTGGKKVGQGALDGGEANVRAGLGYLLLGDLARSALDDGLDAFRLGYLAITKVLNTVLEFIIGFNHDPQHALEEGKIVVSVLVPVLGTGLQRFIIGVLALLDEHLDADVLAHNELIKDTNIIRSMSRAGKPTDNPVNEALNGWINE